MKQFVLCVATAYPSTITSDYDFSQVASGNVALAVSNDGDTGLSLLKSATTALTKDFAIVVGGGTETSAKVIPVDFDSLTWNVSTPQAAVKKVVTVTIKTTAKDDDTVVTVAKLGVKFNERSNYSFSYYSTAAGDQATAATKIGAAIKANAEAIGLSSVTVSSNVITITGNDNVDFTVVSETATIKTTTAFVPSINDKAAIKDLALQCAANNGVEYTYADGESIYPKFPVTPAASYYRLYTLRFANGRQASVTRNEKVWQTVHIAMPAASASDTSATWLDTMLGGIPVNPDSSKDE